MYALLLLQLMDHRKQVTRLGIPFRPEHPYEPVLFMSVPEATHFQQFDNPLAIFGLEDTTLGNAFTLAA